MTTCSLPWAPMGYRHSKTDLLAAAVNVAQQEGLAAVTFGRVARQLGIADRTVVYYFPTKEALATELLGSLAGELLTVLDAAFGPVPLPADQLAGRAWEHFSSGQADATFRLFFEAVGLSLAGTAPYHQLVPELIEQWAQWLTPRIDAPPSKRRPAALSTMALLDGLVLLRLTSGPETAIAAAKAAGVGRHAR